MGTLFYGDFRRSLEVDDRMLQHLQLVIIAKLRRGESFALTWNLPPEKGSGRRTIWMHPAIAMEFEFHGSLMPRINQRWLSLLAEAAASSRGLHMLPEPPGE